MLDFWIQKIQCNDKWRHIHATVHMYVSQGVTQYDACTTKFWTHRWMITGFDNLVKFISIVCLQLGPSSNVELSCYKTR
jgi:hypothetical protein